MLTLDTTASPGVAIDRDIPALANASLPDDLVGVGHAGRLLGWIVVGAALVVSGTAALAWHCSMALSVDASGVVVPRQLRQARAAISGIVSEVLVREGQEVVAGEPLARLADLEWSTELRQIHEELAINAQRQLGLVSERRHQGSAARQAVGAARLAVAAAELDLERLRGELGPAPDTALLGPGWHRLPIEELVPVRQQRTALETRRAALRLAEERLTAFDDPDAELSALQREADKLAHRRLLVESRIAASVIRSPSAGTVLTRDVERRCGDRVEAGESLVQVAPLSQWRAELWVRQVDVPRVAAGQGVRLRVEAFPHLEFRTFHGTVEEVAARSGTDSGLFAVRAAVDDPIVRRGNREYRLAAGMTVSAAIEVERGRIARLAWRRLLRGLGSVHDNGPAAGAP